MLKSTISIGEKLVNLVWICCQIVKELKKEAYVNLIIGVRKKLAFKQVALGNIRKSVTSF